MKLIEYDGAELKVADEAYLIRPIRELLMKDKSKNKENFWRQMSYLWFMCDPLSTYMYIVKEDDRAVEIKKQEGFGEDWKPSKELVDAMEQYKKHTVTTSSMLLEDIRIGIDNVRAFLRTVDPAATDSKGKPLYQISAVTNGLKQAIELSKLLRDAEKELAKDYESDNAARGAAKKSAFEDI